MVIKGKSTGSHNVAAALATMELVENDIPQAAMSAPSESHTVSELK